jgi:hypothetical protein
LFENRVRRPTGAGDGLNWPNFGLELVKGEVGDEKASIDFDDSIDRIYTGDFI